MVIVTVPFCTGEKIIGESESPILLGSAHNRPKNIFDIIANVQILRIHHPDGIASPIDPIISGKYFDSYYFLQTSSNKIYVTDIKNIEPDK